MATFAPPLHQQTTYHANVLARQCRVLLGLALTVLLLISRPASAQATADYCGSVDGNAPAHPYTPVDAWIALQDGDQHWYAFRDEGDGTPIMVRMAVAPDNGATFVVLTPAEMSARQAGEAVSPVGAGAPLPALNDDLYWTGSFVQSGIYYVLVESSGRGLSNYMLTIQGSRVSFPLLSFTRPQPPIASQIATCAPTATTPTATPAPTAESITEPSLSSPEAPLPPIGRALAIVPNETHWYAFRDEGDDGAIAIRATAAPQACIDFALWTPDQLELWRQNLDFQPVGQGTVNQQFGGDLFWTGSFVKSGNYYVVVTHNPAQQGPCTYQLRVTGADVSLILPPRN